MQSANGESAYSPDVLRFLGKRFTAEGHINGHVKAEVTSDLKQQQEGVRIKHRYSDNSVKLYDKAYTPAGSVHEQTKPGSAPI